MSRFNAEMSRFNGTRDGTNGGGHGVPPLRGVPPPSVPNVPVEMSPLFVPVSIHGRDCAIRRIRGEYVITDLAGERIAQAPTRFLAVARAALILARPRALALEH